MYKIQTQFWYPFLGRLGWPSWYERIKTGPTPEDNALLQLTRELSVQFQMSYWYKQVVWGRLDRSTSTCWIRSTPTIPSKEIVPVPGALTETALMLPDCPKAKLSLD